MSKSRTVDLKGARGSLEILTAARQVIEGTDDNRYGRVIRKYREKAGMDMAELSRRLGYSPNTTAHWEAGRARPDLDTILPLCALLGIPLNEFFGVPDKGQMVCPLTDTYRSLSRRGQHTLKVMAEALAADEHQAVVEHYRREAMPFRVSRQGFAAAVGTGSELEAFDDFEDTYIKRSAAAEQADVIITVTGRSMEPTFFSGDKVFVKSQSSVEPGEIGIFLHNGEGLIKEYRRDGLFSHNPAVPVRRISSGDDLKCLGRVLRKIDPDEFYGEDEQRLLQEAFSTL